MPYAHVHRLAAATAFAVTACVSNPARAQTIIYDATGGTENGGDSFKTGGRLLADSIMTGSVDETLTSVVLNLAASRPQDGGEFRVVLTPFNTNGFPGPGRPHMIVGVVTDASLTSSFALTTVTLDKSIKLKANTRYFIGVVKQPSKRSSVKLGNTVDPAVLARPSVMAGAYFYNTKGHLQANSSGPYEIQVNVTP